VYRVSLLEHELAVRKKEKFMSAAIATAAAVGKT
jgi:hypothetical protein